MSFHAQIDPNRPPRLRTLAAAPLDGGYRISEIPDKWRPEAVMQICARYAACQFVLLANLLWFFPSVFGLGDSVMAKAALSMAFLSAALVALVISRHGSCRVLRLDSTRREISLLGLDFQGRPRSETIIPLDQIVSVFVRRGDISDGLSTLNFRLSGREDEICVLHGALYEVEALHEVLCRDFRALLVGVGQPAEILAAARQAARQPAPRRAAEAVEEVSGSARARGKLLLSENGADELAPI